MKVVTRFGTFECPAFKKERMLSSGKTEVKYIIPHNTLKHLFIYRVMPMGATYRLSDPYNVANPYTGTPGAKGLSKSYPAIKCTIDTVPEDPTRHVEAYGGASDLSLESEIARANNINIAENRAFDRAVILFLGLGGRSSDNRDCLFYSDSEIPLSAFDAVSDAEIFSTMPGVAAGPMEPVISMDPVGHAENPSPVTQDVMEPGSLAADGPVGAGVPRVLPEDMSDGGYVDIMPDVTVAEAKERLEMLGKMEVSSRAYQGMTICDVYKKHPEWMENVILYGDKESYPQQEIFSEYWDLRKAVG